MKYTLLITGNPVDGFNFALHADEDDAIREGEDGGADWWIAEVVAPPVKDVLVIENRKVTVIAASGDPVEVFMRKGESGEAYVNRGGYLMGSITSTGRE